MSLFFLTFILLYSGMHYYAYRKIFGVVSLPTPVFLVVCLFMAVMVCAPILVRVAERHGLHAVATPLAYSGYLWMGLLFLFMSVSLAFDSIRIGFHAVGYLASRDLLRFFPSDRQTLLAAAAISLGIAVYGYWEALTVRTEKVTIQTQKLPRSIKRFTIVQLSDVHLGVLVRGNRLKRILREVERAKPDMVVSTGDLVDGQLDNMAAMTAELEKLQPPFGKFAVTGNHEYYAGIDDALAFIRRSGFTVLHGQVIPVAGFIALAGFDDPAGKWFGVKNISEKDILKNISRDHFSLVLKHRPVVDADCYGLFDLQLSGHVHKGQIFPFGLVTRLFYPIETGFSRVGESSVLYVSRGAGTWGPPIRFMATPEVTVIELKNTAFKD